jgi:hypothetical protein
MLRNRKYLGEFEVQGVRRRWSLYDEATSRGRATFKTSATCSREAKVTISEL